MGKAAKNISNKALSLLDVFCSDMLYFYHQRKECETAFPMQKQVGQCFLHEKRSILHRCPERSVYENWLNRRFCAAFTELPLCNTKEGKQP